MRGGLYLFGWGALLRLGGVLVIFFVRTDINLALSHGSCEIVVVSSNLLGLLHSSHHSLFLNS